MELTTMVLRGRIGSDPTYNDETATRPFARFRMIVPRYRRTEAGVWEQLEGTWYTVKAWGQLARNVDKSLAKGQPIVVVGRPQAQGWLNREGEAVAEIAINATTIGHDLGLGASQYVKTSPPAADGSPAAAGGPPASVGNDDGVPDEAEVPF